MGTTAEFGRGLPVDLVERLAAIPGVTAVSLGGSRAAQTARPDSDWDIAIYYSGPLDVDEFTKLGLHGKVSQPYAWGKVINGGAWLVHGGDRIDLLYRELDYVLSCVSEAEAGRFEVHHVASYAAGIPTYVLAGELATHKLLVGDLPRPSYPCRLQEVAPRWWLDAAGFSLTHAQRLAARGETALCAVQLVRAGLSAAHALLASWGEWVLNEKGLLERAGLTDIHGIVASLDGSEESMLVAVEQTRELVAINSADRLTGGGDRNER